MSFDVNGKSVVGLMFSLPTVTDTRSLRKHIRGRNSLTTLFVLRLKSLSSYKIQPAWKLSTFIRSAGTLFAIKHLVSVVV